MMAQARQDGRTQHANQTVWRFHWGRPKTQPAYRLSPSLTVAAAIAALGKSAADLRQGDEKAQEIPRL